MLKRARDIVSTYRLTPLVLAALVVISYAASISLMGFFMDDWYLIWYKHLFGALQYPIYFSTDRPLMGYFFIVANFLLGNSESPLVWQIFGLFTRWLCVYALWGFLNTLWPNAKKQNTLVVLLAAVFPGFTQQWIAVVYSFFFTCLAGFFFSLTLMLKAIREPKRFWVYTILSFVIGVYSYAAAEFYFGLELIRPVVLWIEYSRGEPKIRQRLWKTVKTWFPFLITFLVYAVWRGFFFVSGSHKVMITEKFLQSPIGVIVDSGRKIYQAGVDAVVNAWFNPLNIGNYPTQGKVPLLILSAVVLVFVFLILWLRSVTRNNPQESEAQNKTWTREAFWLALVSLIVAVLPFLAADLPIGNEYPFDRFLLAYLFGSCLFIVVFSDKKNMGLYLAVFLVAVSTGYQITNGIHYKNIWVQQSDFFWQLSWRAPGIKSNTVLVTEDLPFSKYFSGTSLTAPLNMIYASDLNSHEIPYLFLITSQQKEVIPDLAPDIPVDFTFRSFNFHGNTSSMLVLKKPTDGCLRILTPSDSPPVAVLDQDRYLFWQSAIALSNLDQINTEPENPAVPAQRFFGDEDRNQWCYFFEKADLARQLQQWDQTIQWYQDAQTAGFKPLVDAEWLPLVEAYLKINKPEKALEITKTIDNNDQTNTTGFCSLWSNMRDNENARLIADEALTTLNCKE